MITQMNIAIMLYNNMSLNHVYPNVDDHFNHFSPMFGRQASPSKWPINKSPATGLQRVDSGEHGKSNATRCA